MAHQLGPKTPEEIDRLRRFARGFVHALNNYLSAASGYHQLIQMSLQSPLEDTGIDTILKFVAEGESAITQAGNLLAAVARWSRPMRITAYEISLPVIVEQLVAEMESVGSNLTSRFLVEAEKGLPKIQGDANLIGRSLKALMDNAVRASDGKGPVRISITRSAGASPDEGWFQVFSIRDQGPGIDPEQIDYLWIPVAASYTPSTEGTLAWSGCGLGLPTAFLTAEIHGGKIVVESKVDGETGTLVSMFLPESGPRQGED